MKRHLSLLTCLPDLFVIAQEHEVIPVRVSTAVLLTTAVSMISLPVLIARLT